MQDRNPSLMFNEHTVLYNFIVCVVLGHKCILRGGVPFHIVGCYLSSNLPFFRCIKMEEAATGQPFHYCTDVQNILPSILNISSHVCKQFVKLHGDITTKQHLRAFCLIESHRLITVLNFLRKAHPTMIDATSVGLRTVEKMVTVGSTCFWVDTFRKIWQNAYESVYNEVCLAAQWLLLAVTHELCITESAARVDFLKALRNKNDLIVSRLDSQRQGLHAREAKRRRMLCARSCDLLMGPQACLPTYHTCSSEINQLVRFSMKVIRECMRSSYVFVGTVRASVRHNEKNTLFVDLCNILSTESQQRLAIEQVSLETVGLFEVLKDGFVALHNRHLFFRTRLFANCYNIWEEAKWTLHHTFIFWEICMCFQFAHFALEPTHTKHTLAGLELWFFDCQRSL